MYKEFIFIYVALTILLIAMVLQIVLLVLILKKQSGIRQKEKRNMAATAQNVMIPSVVFCPTCATQYDANERFCPRCGTPRV